MYANSVCVSVSWPKSDCFVGVSKRTLKVSESVERPCAFSKDIGDVWRQPNGFVKAANRPDVVALFEVGATAELPAQGIRRGEGDDLLTGRRASSTAPSCKYASPRASRTANSPGANAIALSKLSIASA